MKKNLFLKILATTLAFMLVISGGLTALADSRVEDNNGNVLDHQKDLTWNSDVAYAESDALAGETTSLTLDANIINNDSSFALLVYVEDDGKSTVKTGDLTENNDNAYSALHVNTWGEIEKEDVDVTVGKIDSESDGIRIDSNGGDIDVTTEALEAKGTGVFVSNMVDIEPIAGTGKSPYGMTYEDYDTLKTGYMIYSDSNGDLYADFFDGTGMVYQFTETDCSGETDVQINGGVTVAEGSDDDFLQAVVSQNMSENNTSEITVVGDVEVTADDAVNVMGILVEAYDGDASAEITGNIDVSTASTERWASAAGGIAIAYEEGTSELSVTGDITAEGMRATGLELTAGDDYYDKDGGTVKADLHGDITVTGTSLAEGVQAVVAEGGSVTATLEGDITAKAEKAVGILTDNKGGTIDITQEGDVTAETYGLELRDTPSTEDDPSLVGTTVTVIDQEYDYVTQMSDGPGSEPVDVAVYHHENKDGSWYDYYEDGTIFHAEKAVDHDPGTTTVTVIGDVTGEEAGAYIDLTNDKSKIDLIVDGTLSGEKQSVLVSEETIADNLTLTVWEIKANDDGNLVERVAETDEVGEPTKVEADTEIEKNIQYIIKITPAQQDIITTQGTTNYEGYNVANEGDTVTLKVEVPEGYQIKNAFSDSDQTIEMAQDDDGNYYLIVPKGGAVMISVEFEAIPEPEPAPQPEPQPQPAPAAETVEETKTTTTFVQTTKVAIMKPADETGETETLKEEIQTSDIQSILPDDIKEQLPEGVSTVAETITMTLENYDPEMGAVTLKIAPKNKTYTKGEKATVVIALPDGNGGYTYFYIEGEGQEDGTLSLNIPTDTAKALAGKTFVTMILE